MTMGEETAFTDQLSDAAIDEQTYRAVGGDDGIRQSFLVYRSLVLGSLACN
jgi:hypothetical protein